MRLWRICRSRYAALDGAGGLHVSGRWHDRGTPVIYAASTPSLGALELLVHVDADIAPADLLLLEITLPDSLTIEDIGDPEALSPVWQLHPGPLELRQFGSAWVREQRSPLLRVPSALLPVGADVEANFLINPALLPAASEVTVVSHPFWFDSRLL
jgi:RES domain-containing protein